MPKLTKDTMRSVCTNGVPATCMAPARPASSAASRDTAQWRTRQISTRATTASRVASAARPAPPSRRCESRASRVSAITCCRLARAAALAWAKVWPRNGSASSATSNSPSSPSIISAWPCGTVWTLTSPTVDLSISSCRMASERRARRSGLTPRNDARSTATGRLATTTGASAVCSAPGAATAAVAAMHIAAARPARHRRPHDILFMCLAPRS